MSEQTALGLAASLAAGTLHQEAYLAQTREKIQADEHRAFLRLCEPASPAEADSALRGVAVALADNILIKGEPGTAGSKMLANFVPPYQATVVDRLQAAGLLAIGKTNLPEFGLGIAGEDAAFGAVLHPLAAGRVSEGAAAAVALGLTPLALSVDSGGNALRQAAWAGVIGYKPTYGMISRFGLVPILESCEGVAITATTIADAATLAMILAGKDEKDATMYATAQYSFDLDRHDLAGLKIAVPEEYLTAELDEEFPPALDACLALLREQGAQVKRVSLPAAAEAQVALQVMTAAEGANNLSRYDGIKYGYQSPQNTSLEDVYCQSRSEAFGIDAKRTAILGAYLLTQDCYQPYYLQALKLRRQLQQQTEALFRDYDLILNPVARGPAYDLRPTAAYYQDFWQDSRYTAVAALLGLPALSLPIGRTAAGLPLGIHLTAAPLQDQTLIRLALGLGL